ncbi:MAG: AAA family ATPase [Acidimicrobiales bacterium]
MVDLDPQGNASTGLGINIRGLQASMYDVILSDVPIEDCIEASSVKNLFVAPASLDLAGAEIELVPAFSRELRLKQALDEVREDYDYILIDCPPSLGLLTINGMAAAGEVLVPIQCEYYALEGLGQLMRNVGLVTKEPEPVARHLDDRARDVRRSHQAVRPGGPGGARALRREGVPDHDPTHRPALRGPVLRSADHGVRSDLPGRGRLPGAGEGGQRWPGVADSARARRLIPSDLANRDDAALRELPVSQIEPNGTAPQVLRRGALVSLTDSIAPSGCCNRSWCAPRASSATS